MSGLQLWDITTEEGKYFSIHYFLKRELNCSARTIYKRKNPVLKKCYEDTDEFVLAIKKIYQKRDCILLDFKDVCLTILEEE